MLPSYPTAKGVAGNKLQAGAPWAEGLCAGVTSHPGTAVSMEHPSLPARRLACLGHPWEVGVALETAAWHGVIS